MPFDLGFCNWQGGSREVRRPALHLYGELTEPRIDYFAEVWVSMLSVMTGFLLALCAVLITVSRLRPRRFKLKAMLTKWVTFDLEMESPETTDVPITLVEPPANIQSFDR